MDKDNVPAICVTVIAVTCIILVGFLAYLLSQENLAEIQSQACISNNQQSL